MTDPTRRFSTRVENYVRHRPSYPLHALAMLKDACGLTPDSIVADVGSGTGALTRLFLENGNRVFAVEPNREMRLAAEEAFRGHAGFISVAARAEDTTLPDGSVDLVTAGQAFHWFERESTRREFTRILRPGGWATILWNERRERGTPFLEAYERLLRRHGTDYEAVHHRWIDSGVMESFFSAGSFLSRSFENRQLLDLEGLKGRLLSSSYAPEAGHPGHAAMIEELEEIFRRHQEDEAVTIEYDTRVYAGRLS